MKMKLTALLVGFAVAAPVLAHASIEINCGQNYNDDKGDYKKKVIQVSSEDDNFSGPAGKNWSLWKGKRRSESKGSKYTAVLSADHATLTITAVTAQTPSGPVGTKYIISKPYEDAPTLSVTNLGGVTGPIQTGSFDCMGSQD